MFSRVVTLGLPQLRQLLLELIHGAVVQLERHTTLMISTDNISKVAQVVVKINNVGIWVD